MAYLTQTGTRRAYIVGGRGVSPFTVRRYHRALQAIQPPDAVAQIISPGQYVGAKMVQKEKDAVLQAATTGQIPWGPDNWASGFSCSNTSQSSGAKILGSAAGIGLGIGGKIAATLAPAAAVPVIGWVVAGVGALVGLFEAIFAHHAQAVAKEEQVLCASVPAANDSLTAIEQAVAAGTMTPAQGIAALQQLQREFANAVSSIIKDDETHCNAACVWAMCLAAAALTVGSQWQDQANAAAQKAAASPQVSGNTVAVSTSGAAVGSTTAPASAVSTLEQYWPIAAVILIGVMLLK
jgi:hypothetical protein